MLPDDITWYMGTSCHTKSKNNNHKFVNNNKQFKLVINVYVYKLLLVICLVMKLCAHM